MKYTLLLRAAAQREVEDAARWYEAREPELGPGFLAAVEVVFQRLETGPLGCAPVWSGEPFRRALTERFPYQVYFEVVEERVVILAVAHERRRPGYWRERD